MEQGAYKGDVLQKIAGLSFIVGTIVLVVFGLLHPAEDLEDLSATIQALPTAMGDFGRSTTYSLHYVFGHS